MTVRFDDGIRYVRFASPAIGLRPAVRGNLEFLGRGHGRGRGGGVPHGYYDRNVETGWRCATCFGSLSENIPTVNS